MGVCQKTVPAPLSGVVGLPGEDRPWEPGGILGRACDGRRPAPELEASVYRDRLVAMGRKGRASAMGQAGALILKHGDDALRWVLRTMAPSAGRLRLVRHLEQAGLSRHADAAVEAERLIAEHGDDALRWVLREREPSVARLRIVRHLERAGLEGPVQVEAFE